MLSEIEILINRRMCRKYRRRMSENYERVFILMRKSPSKIENMSVLGKLKVVFEVRLQNNVHRSFFFSSLNRTPLYESAMCRCRRNLTFASTYRK